MGALVLKKKEDDNRLIVVEASAINTMHSFRQIRSTAHEAGGVIIGERRGDSFIVKEVTIPSPKDISSRFQFVRQDHHHQSRIIDANKSSGGTYNYLGEWHTHPEKHPTPSQIDLDNWRHCLRNHTPCLVAIIGIKSDWMAVFERGEFFELEKV
ncbi:MAG: peptidase [Halobacteriovoraceae bacterium]|nr:peptidase [Halobacteriovoraceae bacterium]